MIQTQDINQILYNKQTQILHKITMMRAKKVNEMIESSLPSWKVWIMKRLKFLSKYMGYYVSIQPLELLEGDVCREELRLHKKDKIINRITFAVWDQRVKDNAGEMKWD